MSNPPPPTLPTPGGTIGPGTGSVTSLDQLTLANGMTAGYGLGGQTSNPPLAPGSQGGNPKYAPQRIGFLTSVASAGGNNGVLYFLYNPNEIDVSFSTDPTQVPPNYSFGSTPNQGGTIALANAVSAQGVYQSQSVSWSLYFDRTYELVGAVGGDNRGVLKDTGALYALMGTFIGGANGPGVPLAFPCQVVFGVTGNGAIWGFTGYLSTISIEYGIFRHDMIPSKCQVDLTMTCMYVAPQTIQNGSTFLGAAAAAGSALPGAGTLSGAPTSTLPQGPNGTTLANPINTLFPVKGTPVVRPVRQGPATTGGK